MPQADRSPTPRASVIMPMYNAEQTLEMSLQSVLDTDWPNLEVIVVDDASTDHSRSLVQGLIAREPKADLHLLSHPDHGNHGAPHSRNLGIENATGDYVCFLDADDLYFPQRLVQAVDALEADATLDAVFGLFCYLPSCPDSRGPLRDIRSMDFEFDVSKIAAADEDLFLALLNGRSGIHTSTVTIRRECLLGLGGFPNLKYVDDQALWLRLLATRRVARVGERPVAGYRIHTDSWCSRGERTPEFFFGPVISRLDALRWLRGRPVSPRHRTALIKSLVSRLCHRASALDSAEPRMGSWMRKLMWQTIATCPSVLLDRRILSMSRRLLVQRHRNRT